MPCSFAQVPCNFFQVLSAENYKAERLFPKVKNVKVQPGIPVENCTPKGHRRGSAHRTARPLAAGTEKHRQRRSFHPNGLPENENPPLQNPSPSTENTIAAAPRPQKRSKKVRKGFALQKPLRNFAQKFR